MSFSLIGFAGSTVLLVAHVLAVPLAVCRLTDILMTERIAEPLRRRGGYLFGCRLCLSVWVGALATMLLLGCPWLNWPFALSYLYLWMTGWSEMLRQRRHEELALFQVKMRQWSPEPRQADAAPEMMGRP